MIISRTPFRISFFGGGTDYHTWYQEFGGKVISTSINHYCYITCRYLPPFLDKRSRVVWSQIEEIDHHNEIKHPAVRAALDYLNIESGIEIHHQGDLPSRSGLGSSSAFTVGMLNALYALQGQMSSKKQLACEAVHIERDLLQENVGVQDQLATAYGGLNKIDIFQNGEFSVQPVILPHQRLEELQKHFLLFYTGVARTASEVAGKKIAALKDKKAELTEMAQMVDIAVDILSQNGNLDDFGRLLHESWQLKRGISSAISNDLIDDAYQAARDAGALGGKLLGAGGGGFMLFFAKPEKHPAIMQALEKLLLVPFQFETNGSTIIFVDESARFTLSSRTRRDYVHIEAEQKQQITRPLKFALV